MKRFILRWIMPYALGVLIDVLRDLAKRSDNDIDDQLVETLAENTDKIIEIIKMH